MKNEELKSALRLGVTDVRENMLLAPLSSFKIGGRCAVAVFPKNKAELAYAIKLARRLDIKYDVVGKASNLLFPDDDYDGMLVFTAHMSEFWDDENGYVYAMAGVNLGALASAMAKRSLSGLEFAFGIPGSIGGAVFMNAGAYGGEMKDVVIYSDYYDPNTDTFGRFEGETQEFSYRESVYSKRKDLIILGAALLLKNGSEAEIRQKMDENMQKRREKQPLEFPNAGSAFKRPQIGYAAQMIDECGLKGLSVGGAQVSEKHAGFIINKNNATAKDVKDLMNEVKARVLDRFGVMLETEIRYID
jgi:UDP-N-acetylmuramate dehydrogenase